MTDYEHLTAASYYLIYKSFGSNASNQLVCNAQRSEFVLISTDPSDPEEDLTAQESNKVWEPDEWNDADYTRAQCLLDDNMDKCDILLGCSSMKQGEKIIHQYEEQSQQNWNKFYVCHENNFFKDRHYLLNEFPNELGCLYQKPPTQNSYLHSNDDVQITHDFVIVEIGCGVGNAILPLLELDPFIYQSNQIKTPEKRVIVWALDFSSVAIEILKKDNRFVQAHHQGRAYAQVWDITCQDPPIRNAQISLLLFCLSAITPENMKQAALHIAATLKAGGTLLIRDYGRYDEAQIKLGTSRKKRLGENFYVKHDGTRCYYFTLDDLERLFVENAGLEKVDLKYIHRRYTNRGDQTIRRRVWVQASFQKPYYYT